MTKRYALYISDDGLLHVALWIDIDTFVVMGFTDAPIGTERRPQKLDLRKQLFINTAGDRISLPYPTVASPYGFEPVTVRGDPTYWCVGQTDERGTGESI
jgi:hypothetical protein